MIFFALTMIGRPSAADDSELLSIRGVVLPQNGYVVGFTIKTWGVDVLAVCHFPPGWTITAGKSADPEGILAGGGSHGVTWLNAARIGELGQLFLIKVSDYRAHEAHSPNVDDPATFSGKLLVGDYGNPEADWREVSLLPANFVREPASRCP